MSVEIHDPMVDLDEPEFMEDEDSQLQAQDVPYVFFLLADKAYGVSSELVLSMHTMEDCTPIVDFPAHIRGVVDFRGQAISLCDLRKLFKLQSYADELEEFISHRVLDHKNWVEVLEKSVRERTPFSLTTDPHQCAFGKWYDTYQTDNNVLSAHLQKINRPHQLVHESAIDVKRLMDQEDYDGALLAVEKLKATHYKETIALLNEIASAYRAGNREIVIVLDFEGKTFGIIVDKIISVEPIAELIDMPEGSASEYVTKIAKRNKEPSMVLLLDCSKL